LLEPIGYAVPAEKSVRIGAVELEVESRHASAPPSERSREIRTDIIASGAFRSSLALKIVAPGASIRSSLVPPTGAWSVHSKS